MLLCTCHCPIVPCIDGERMDKNSPFKKKEWIRSHFKDVAEIPLVPPGFAPLTSFTLRRVQDDVMMCRIASEGAFGSQPAKVDNKCSISDDVKVSRAIRRRPWIKYHEFDNSSDEESDSGCFDEEISSIPHLPKGVIRGCMECSNCQKVIARWKPESACRPALDEVPVFYPSEEEFKDALKYIASISKSAEPYGICRIVPPASWNPPCSLKEKNVWENAKFATRVQQVDKLQNRISGKRMLRYYKSLDRKRRRLKMGVEGMASDGDTAITNELGCYNVAERFGFEPGLEFTLDTFQKYADDFKEQYFCMKEIDTVFESNLGEFQKLWEPTLENIEGEYWRMVEKPTEEIEVLYGADIETKLFGSGFPKASFAQSNSDLEDQYVKSDWNLNNFSRLPSSVLSFESGDISGVQVPWLYVGMCFSSFCWHVEDHHLYSMNYMHWGAPKIWYGVPGKDALKLEAAMKKHLPELFEEQPDLLHNLVTQLSPSILKSEGIPVYRCIQHPREFVLTFPRAYHSGFNCGFNCAEAVNVAPVDWLPHGQSAVELYREQRRKTTICHDKLLLGAAREAVRAQWELLLLRKNTLNNLRWKEVCGKDGLLAKALKARVEMERVRREYLSSPQQSRKMDANFDATSERECVICLYDLHLSAAGCQCSPDRFACLNHAKQLCSCTWSARFFLFRYEINELNIVVEALEGRLSAIHRWAYLDLGLTLSSHVTKDKSQELPQHVGRLSTVETEQKTPLHAFSSTVSTGSSTLCQETKASMPQPSLEEWKPKEVDQIQLKTLNSRDYIADASSLLPKTSLDGRCINTLNRKDIRDTCGQQCSLPQAELGNQSFESRDGCSISDSKLLPLPDKREPKRKKDLALKDVNIINLSDDEGEDALISSLTRTAEVSTKKHPEISTEDILPNDTFAGSPHNPCNESSVAVPSAEQVKDISSSRELSSCNATNIGCDVQNQSPLGTEKLINGGDCGISIMHSIFKKDSTQVTGNPFCPVNAMDRHQQRGPCIAKVVQRVHCTVEPLELGVVLSGKLWSNSKAIFPKGFRSRVQYISVLDPTKMCYYISEILDAGLLGPLFMVTVEECPSEIFLHVSATKCWDLVMERVNDEIKKQHSMSRLNLPLQPPGCLDGLEMFGFSSPAIVQAIEAMDQKHICIEYWKSRPGAQFPQQSLNGNFAADSKLSVEEELKDDLLARIIQNRSTLSGRVDALLRSVFKKADPEELHALQTMFSSDRWSSNQTILIQLLDEEIKKR